MTILFVASTPFVAARGGPAARPQPAPDITKMGYAPIGFYSPGDPIPSPQTPPTNPNPSGKWVAYDTNVYESLALPSRHPGDTTRNDPPGSGDPRYGFCPAGDPSYAPWGLCTNHQLEYLDYFERAMKEILGDFGVVVHRYPFVSPGSGGRGGLFDAAGGQAYNISATVAGADHPDESVLVSGHYDVTDSGPAPAWDSSEGHATVIRVAKIMADSWRATGTRPSATVKFIPWDSEESGTWGSRFYVRDNIPPGEADKVRAYFNMDPCAGAYPAFRHGDPAERVPEVMQLANPAAYDDPAVRARVVAFNKRAETIVDEVFDHLDDAIEVAPGVRLPIFVSDAEATATTPSQRREIVTAVGGLAVFSSDYANFAAAGIPIFNLFPDYFGPHADGTPGSPEGATILHTPRDNLTSINALTSADASGETASEGWAKGLEMCAHIEGWYMLQPEMGGAGRVGPEPVAYFEALPNEVIPNQKVRFDASGSYAYANPAARTLLEDSRLQYLWDFGDGQTGAGRVVDHAYARVGRYPARLRVHNAATGRSDTMTLPVEVVPSSLTAPVLTPPAPDDADGAFTLAWDFKGEQKDLSHFSVQETTSLKVLLADDAEGDIGQLWTASAPSDPRVHPWQRSDGALALNGNKRHSGLSSYWTGAFPTAPSPTGVESVLTLTEPVALPKQGVALLSYWSLFQSEGDDQGRLEVAVEDADLRTEPEWQPVDVLGGFFTLTDPVGSTQAELRQRRVDLSRYQGRNVRLRFRYLLGGEDRVASQPAGWYVDDVRLESAVWDEIGATKAKSFRVSGRARGSYGYRVVGVYRGGIESAPSNTETVRVVAGARPSTVLGTKQRRGELPGTGVGEWALLGLVLLGLSAGLGRGLRRAR